MKRRYTLSLFSLLAMLSFEAVAKRTIDSTLKFSSVESKENFCASRNSGALMKQRFFDPNERLDFNNGPYGLGGGGVCWWHTRFQRNALYLTNFEPSKEKPSLDEAKKIIRRIRNGDDVVNIPGFANLKEFSAAYSNEIIKELEDWQLVDGFVKQKWMQGLSGKSSSVSDMKTEMDKMYEKVAVNKQLTYAKVQLQGVTSHAMMVGEMEKTADGYTLQVIDSNSGSEVTTYHYKEGDDSLKLAPGMIGDVDSFVPYVEFTNEVEKMEKVIASTCDGYNIETDIVTCGPSDAMDEDNFSVNHIFNPGSHGFDLPGSGQNVSPPEGGAGDCSSRSDIPKVDVFMGNDPGEMRSSSGSSQ